MAEEGTIKTFVLIVTFLLIYSALLGTMPAGFTTDTYASAGINPVQAPELVGFDNYTTYNSNSSYFTLGVYDYELAGHLFTALDGGSNFQLALRVPIFIFFFRYEWASFTFEGADRGGAITWGEVNADAVNGTVRYSASTPTVTTGLVFQWNTTAYTYPWDAWGNESLGVIHGIGASAYAPQSALSLVFSMLTFSVPDIPILLQVLVSAPIYASVIYLIWFFIKEVIPFL